jgi:hypothetical protein
LENLSNLAALWEKALALFFGLPQANDSRVAFILNFELGQSHINHFLITPSSTLNQSVLHGGAHKMMRESQTRAASKAAAITGIRAFFQQS